MKTLQGKEALEFGLNSLTNFGILVFESREDILNKAKTLEIKKAEVFSEFTLLHYISKKMSNETQIIYYEKEFTLDEEEDLLDVESFNQSENDSKLYFKVNKHTGIIIFVKAL